MAEELLRSIMVSILTKTITINQPGVARFLTKKEGTNILKEMEAKFEVYVSLEKVHWDPLENEDIFESAWKMTSEHNFPRASADGACGSALTRADTDAHTAKSVIMDKHGLRLIIQVLKAMLGCGNDEYRPSTLTEPSSAVHTIFRSAVLKAVHNALTCTFSDTKSMTMAVHISEFVLLLLEVSGFTVRNEYTPQLFAKSKKLYEIAAKELKPFKAPCKALCTWSPDLCFSLAVCTGIRLPSYMFHSSKRVPWWKFLRVTSSSEANQQEARSHGIWDRVRKLFVGMDAIK